MASIVILGAGLTGLSAAYHLDKHHFADYQIFEKQDRAGGLLRSWSQDGFTFDFTGHFLHSNNPYFSQFLEDITGPDKLMSVQRKAAIFMQGCFADYPFQMNLRNLPFETMYECIDGFIARSKHTRNPQSFYEWVLKYFGKGFGKHFFFPYNSKLLAYDIKQVTPSWTGRFVPQTSLKAILQGAMSAAINGVGYNSAFLYPKQGGIEFLIKQLERKLLHKVTTEHTVDRIDIKKKIIYFSNGNQVVYEKLLSTLPLDRLLGMLVGATHRTYNTAQDNLICNTVVNFNLAFDTMIERKEHWIYFPEKAYDFYRLGFWHNINAQLVKPGCSAVYGEVSFINNDQSKKSYERKIRRAITQSLDFLRLERNNILIEKLLYLDHAYVIYNRWRENNLTKLLDLLEQDGIYSRGRFGAWKYSSMQEAVLDGKEVVEELMKSLRSV